MNKKSLTKLIGLTSKKNNLNPKVTKSIDKGQYFLKTIHYNVDKNERINAFLLVPKNHSKKTPGIVALHQHALEYNIGKSETAGTSGNEMYAYGLELCLRGYIVLCPDFLCFEERQNKKLEGMWYERFKFMEYLLKGSSLQAKYISDTQCAIQVLKSLENIDKENIGIIGHSLGGQETTWSMIFGDVKAGVSSCGFSQMKNIIKKEINHSFSTYIPNLLKHGDMKNIISLIAPKNFLIIAGEKDPIFPIEGVKEIEKAIKKKRNNFNIICHKGKHEFPKEIREKAYSWLDSVLKK